MTSFSNIGRGLGAGLIGLGILTTLSVGGCGDGGGDPINLDAGGGTVDVQEPLASQTRVLYEFTRSRLVIPNSAVVTFFDISLLDAQGERLIRQRFNAADSVQLIVPTELVSRVASTRVDVLGADFSVVGQFQTPLVLTEGQTNTVANAPLTPAVLTSLSVTTTDEAGILSQARTGSLQLLGGQVYTLVTLGTFTVNGETTVTNISNANVTYTASNTNIIKLNNGTLQQGPSAVTNDKATVTAAYGGRTGTLTVNITGLAAPSPTPFPSPSVQVSPDPSPSVSTSPIVGVSPTASPSPTAFASPTPIGSPVVSPTPLLISPTPTPLPSTVPGSSP